MIKSEEILPRLGKRLVAATETIYTTEGHVEALAVWEDAVTIFRQALNGIITLDTLSALEKESGR